MTSKPMVRVCLDCSTRELDKPCRKPGNDGAHRVREFTEDEWDGADVCPLRVDELRPETRDLLAKLWREA